MDDSSDGKDCHMRKMLHKYGQEVVAMDATYQTSKYDLSTFFVCVATNIGYQIVATIVIDKETTSQIEEGLRMLKKWNPGWTPKYFVCDFDIREITAIERVFDNVLVYLCKFHMEQAWDRWLGAKKHGVVRWKTDITDQLRHIAQASDEEGYMNEVEALRNHDAYKDKDSLKFRNWVEKKWLSSSKRWVKCFRQEMVNIRINTTNGVERMHQELKRNYLNKYSHGGTLESQLRVIMTRFLPDLERKYIENNTLGRADFRKYDDDVPIFLHDRPAKFVRHCLARLNSNLEVNENETSEYFRESFLVRNLESGTENTVTFIDRLPDCSCSDWKKYKWPCKHILFIISNNEELHWSQLNSDYTEQPCFVLDYHIECVDLNNTSDTNEEDLPKENETETEETLRNCCITSLKNIQSGIYCITDMDTLGNLNTKLREIEELSNSGKDYLGSLPLRKRKKKKEKQVQQQKRVRIDKQDDDSVIIDGVFDVPLTDTMDNAVLEIWNQPADDLPLLQVGPYVVTRRSFHYIRTTLSDDVIDASLAMMVKGRNIYHINCITASAIFNGREDIHHNLSQVNLHMFDACIGAVNEGGSHWSLVLKSHLISRCVRWIFPALVKTSETPVCEFLTSRYRCGLENSPPENWTLETLEHSKQLDGNSCGVYVIKFAENYIHKRSLCFSWTRADIYEERKRIAKTILSGGTGDISAQENESVTPDLPEVTPDLPEVTQDLPKVTPDLHEVTPDLPEVTTEPAEARQEKPSKVKCYQLRGLKPKRKMSSFIYPSISKKKRELHGEAVTKETRKETRKLQLKDIQDCWSSVANHLKDIVSCTEKSCDESEHARHHAFIVDPVNYASRQRKLYGYGSDAYEEAAVEWFQDKMPSLIKYDLHPRTPATSARISTMEGVHKQSRLYQIFVELGLSIEYLYGVLLKESMAYCLCAELKMAYEQADHLCMKTEFDRTKRPKT